MSAVSLTARLSTHGGSLKPVCEKMQNTASTGVLDILLRLRMCERNEWISTNLLELLFPAPPAERSLRQ